MTTKKIIFTVFAALLFFASCRKEDNPIIPDGLGRAPVPQLSKDASADQSIASSDVSGFTGKVVVDQYFKGDHSYTSIEAVIIKNSDASRPEVLQSGITSLPATITFTGDQLGSLFGEPVVPGDDFTIGINVTLANGQVLEAFPQDGFPSYDPNVFTLPGVGPMTVNYAVFCPFAADDFTGDYTVINDDWADYQPGDIIPGAVTAGPGTNQLSLSVYPNPAAGTASGPIIVDVDPATNNATVSKQVYGQYDGSGFGDFSAEGTGAVNSCNQTITLTLEHTVALGSFGFATLTIQKIE